MNQIDRHAGSREARSRGFIQQRQRGLRRCLKVLDDRADVERVTVLVSLADSLCPLEDLADIADRGDTVHKCSALLLAWGLCGNANRRAPVAAGARRLSGGIVERQRRRLALATGE